MKRSALVVALASLTCLIASACAGQNTPTSPSQPVTPVAPVQACEANNTATVTFRNNSQKNYTYSIVWDGSNIATLPPGTTSQSFTVAAGVPHTLLYRIANTSNYACNPATPTLAQCSSQTHSCAG